MSKMGEIYQTINELHDNGVDNEKIAEITNTSSEFIQNVIESKQQNRQQRVLTEVDFENNSNKLL